MIKTEFMQNFLDNPNNKVEYSKDNIIQILKELEFIICSLDRINRYYYQERQLYEIELTSFIDDSEIGIRWVKIRTILTVELDLEVGEDEMDDLERICEDIPYWRKPDDYCTEEWLRPVIETLDEKGCMVDIKSNEQRTTRVGYIELSCKKQNGSSKGKIEYSKEKMLLVLKELNYLVCSLDRIGSYYPSAVVSYGEYMESDGKVPDRNRKHYNGEDKAELAKFIDYSRVLSRLEAIREFLKLGLERKVGEEEMEKLERVYENIPYWRTPGDNCIEKWAK